MATNMLSTALVPTRRRAVALLLMFEDRGCTSGTLMIDLTLLSAKEQQYITVDKTTT